MIELEQFQQLKEKILLEYQKKYPFFQGNWKNFSSQDIQNLIHLLEENQKQTVSEKWIYTHLKTETNSKLPRKNILDIFSKFTGYSGWDEFVFREEENIGERNKIGEKRKKRIVLLIGSLAIIIICLSYYFVVREKKPETNTIELKDAYTNEKIQEENIKVYKEDGDGIQSIDVKNSEIQIENKSTKIIIESPYYKKKTLIIKDIAKEGEKTKIELKPDDYAMMLKAFMHSNIKDWQTRKVQLDKILSNNLEVIVMLKNNLGVEYFNKKEFSEKLIIPTESVKKMKIIEIQNNENDEITFIRIKQE